MQLPKRRGLAPTIIGLMLMLVIAPAAAGIGIWLGVSGGMNAVSDTSWVSPGDTVHVTGTDDQTILVEGRYGAGHPLPSCNVSGPGGKPRPVRTGSAGLSMVGGGTAYSRAGTFTSAGTGDYTIDCSGHRTKVLSSSVANGVRRRVLIPLGIGIGLAILAFAAGVGLLIVGIVKLVNSGHERSRARAALADGPGGDGTGLAPYRPLPGSGEQPEHGPDDPQDPYRR